MPDEFRFTCPNGHSFVSSNRIRAFCPECGSNTRRNASSKPDPTPSPTANKKGITIKRPVVKTKEPPKPPVKESPTPSTKKETPASVPTKRTNATASGSAHTTRKPGSSSNSRPSSKQTAKPLSQRKPPTKSSPKIARKVPRTTKQANTDVQVETMFTRMRRHAFGR